MAQSQEEINFSKVRGLDTYMRSLWSQFESLTIDDGVMYRKSRHGMQSIVPKSERRNVLLSFHDIKTPGHLGIRKTHGKIAERF